MKNKAFHASWAALHLSAFFIAVKILWDALGEDGLEAKGKAAGAGVAALMHGSSVEHHVRHYYVD